MNVQKILKSPAGVVILSIAALGMIFLNVVLPLISEDTGISETAPDREATPAAVPASPETPVDPGGATPAVPAGPNSLRIIGWKFSASRDPFTVCKDRVNPAPAPEPPSPTGKQPEQRAAARRAPKKPVASASTPALQAIMQGPAGKSALIDGRMVREGDRCSFGTVKKITANSVIFTTSRGSGELRLANRK